MLDKELGRAAADLFRDKEHRQNAEHRHDHQVHTVEQHDEDQGRQRQCRRVELRQALGDHLAQRVRVVRVVAHDIAMVCGVKVLDRQLLHIVKHPDPVFMHKARGDARQQLGVRH